METAVNILVECTLLIASVRVGVLEPLKPLQESGKCNVIFKETLNITRKHIEWCDILVCVRGFEYVSKVLVDIAKKAEKYVIYFLDDDLLDIPNAIDNIEFLRYEENRNSMISILQKVDILWCVNPLIGEKYSKISNSKYYVGKVPTVINSDRFCNISKEESKKVNILYAGSIGHSKMINNYLTPAVLKLCQEFGNSISFTFIGVSPKLVEHKNVRTISYLNNYDDYKNFVNKNNFSVGIAVIGTEDFYKFKYYNKFIEYTSSGAVGVYTKSEPYTLIIENEFNGFLCENSIESWYTTLKKAIIDENLRNKCLENAINQLKTEFNYNTVSNDLLKNIPELTNYYAKKLKKSEIQIFNLKGLFYIGRLKYIISTYGLLSIFVLVFKVIKKGIKALKKGEKMWL